jgi:hypothetical protein
LTIVNTQATTKQHIRTVAIKPKVVKSSSCFAITTILSVESRGPSPIDRHLQHQFPAGLWQADTDEITHENVWEKNYTVQIPRKEIDMLPSGNIDAYTDGSLMGGKSGAGSFILKKSEGKRRHFCSLRGNTKQATVFQSEVIFFKTTLRLFS